MRQLSEEQMRALRDRAAHMRAAPRTNQSTMRVRTAEYKVKNLRSLRAKKCAVIPREPGNTCDMCGQEFTGTPHLDHDHDTRVFRGWLCKRCNTGLGLLGDNLAGVRRAMDYLQRSTGITELPSNTEIVK